MLETTESMSSAASFSILVTSTRIFFVFVVTVVSAALIIGGNDTVFPSLSIIIGTFFESPRTHP